MSLKKLNLCGYNSCGFYRKAKTAIAGLTTIFPDKYEMNLLELPDRDSFQSWLSDFRKSCPAAAKHTSSPVFWFDENSFVGGCTEAIAWCRKVSAPTATVDDAVTKALLARDDSYSTNHSYDYDLVVIGGGSGGLACSKRAQMSGAKVAVLDFVKPSPKGSKWGLGGTCVNVGCIPKKLMHNSALLGEQVKDAVSFGWTGLDKFGHNWESLRQNVQDHIKGLNFGYRVQLREKGVTYLNKLGRFVGPNELECTDSKGKTQSITSARFVIAVGGRPTPLSCLGQELAISSDDIFMLEKAPGKTCIIGAGYVALECAGFLNGINPGSVTVLIRSIPLRGFDRECVGKITDNMVKMGIKMIDKVIPTQIVKLASGKLQVTYKSSNDDNGEVFVDEFDTVLCATGRTPDLKGINLPAVGDVTINKNGKIQCTNEQTSVNHVYAIGDVVDGCPELTPVAIKAGQLLAQRLFGGSEEVIIYKEITTTIFTPLEFGTVGLNEEEAIESFGSGNIEVYISSFSPLEWTISEHREGEKAFCKVVVQKLPDSEKVLGMHIVTPNAGEIMQGFGCAFRKGLTFQDLKDTVGIHPTVAEAFVTLSVTKSSGESAEKGGC